MNSLNNTSAVLRSLIVYAISVPLSILVGYTLTNPLDYQSIGFIGVLVAILVFPVLMKWHYPWLLFSWTAPFLMFFLPGRPNMFMVLVVASLSISVLERILSSKHQFLSVPQVTWPLIAILGVVFLTAQLTGGIGMRSLGGNVYGGRKYASLIIGILCFFALIARAIPKPQAKLYMTLFLIGGIFSFIQDLYPVVPQPLQFIYMVFGLSGYQSDTMGNYSFEMGVTRLGGIAATGSTITSLMLAHYGVRGIFLGGKLWRPVVFVLAFGLIFLGGFRSHILTLAMLFSLLFWLEGLHRSRLIMPFAMIGILGMALLVPLSSHLPHTAQRALAFLPLKIDPKAKMDAAASSQWRLDMWEALLPQVPNYILLGKGLAIKTETFNEVMGKTAFKTVDPAQDPLSLANDFHSGPLSLIIPFGIWGVLAWLWFWAGGLYVLYRNMKYGDPELRYFSRYLFATYVCTCITFTFIFGDMCSMMFNFCGWVGLSVALNHGVCGPAKKTVSAATPAFSPPLANPRPAFQR